MIAASPPVYSVASRQASSFASVPDVVNRHVSSSGGIVARIRSASPTMPPCRYRECVFSSASCRPTARVTAGCACPMTATLLYASR